MQLNGSVFLVTGGSSGLGAACVNMLAQSGAAVVIADVNSDAGGALASSLGPAARFVRCDVTDEANVRDAVAAATDAFGKLNSAVNCAGIGPAERILGKTGPHPLASFTKVIQINLIGTFNVLRLAAAAIAQAPAGEDGERGLIVNTASVAAYDGQIGQAAYSASKGGIVSLTLPAARELARFGIRVVSIAPGIFDTPLLAALPQAARDSLAQQVPFPARLGRPDEYAQLLRQVAENTMINGCVLRLDGAMRMGAR